MKLLAVSFFLLLLLVNCAENDRIPLDPQSVWTVSRYDSLQGDRFRTIKIRFRDNGYAYEENTILKYPYRVFHSSNTFEFNRKIYKILEWKEKEIILQNRETEIVVVFRRE